MRTDAALRTSDRTIVIDAKFYRQPLVRHMGGEEKVCSAHLYQLLTYLRHIRPPPGTVEGVLLYPRIDGRDLRLEYALADHRVRVHTLALDRDWRDVHHEVLELVASPIS